MKILKDILTNVSAIKIIGDTAVHINELKLDSRKVQQGDVFFAIKGITTDGHTFITKVIEQGAAVIVT